jgi:hypothetical protein
MDNVEHTCTPIDELVPDYYQHVNRDSFCDLALQIVCADLNCRRCLFAASARGVTDYQSCGAIIERHDLYDLWKQISDARSTAHARTVYSADEIPF